MEEAGQEPQPAAIERTGQALIGAASIAIAAFMGLAVIGLLVLEIINLSEGRTMKRSVTQIELVIAVLAFLGLLLGAALGAVGLIQKTKKRHLPIAGCALNFMAFALGIVTLIVAFTSKHRF
ncbi:MAG: hypothetical protein ACAI25_05425 [Planctomycetota bacterium]